MPPRSSSSALVIEELLDLLSHSGHDGGVEERIETCEQECADDHSDKDLDAGVNVAFAAGIGNGGLGADCESVELVGDGVDDLFH